MVLSTFSSVQKVIKNKDKTWDNEIAGHYRPLELDFINEKWFAVSKFAFDQWNYYDKIWIIPNYKYADCWINN